MSDEKKPERMGYDDTLAYTQSLRKDVVEKIIETSAGIPVDDDKRLDFMLRTLKDMDGTALNDRKNNIDQSNADSSREVAEGMQEFLRLQANRNPFERQPDGSIVDRPAPSADVEKLGNQSTVEGEEEIGVVEETSASFMERMEQAKND